VAEVLSSLDVGAVWSAAVEDERRVLVEEFLEWVTVFPDHLEVSVIGAPALNVRLCEVGLKESEIVGVGGPTQQECNLPLAIAPWGSVADRVSDVSYIKPKMTRASLRRVSLGMECQWIVKLPAC
jgi:hypothetical protein